jgi:hypothetical protein
MLHSYSKLELINDDLSSQSLLPQFDGATQHKAHRDSPRGNHAMLSAQPGPPTSQLRLAYRRPPHDPARESHCHETADRTPRIGNRTCKYLMAFSQVDRHSSEQQVAFICPCSEPMSASCTADPARLRLDRSRVARGGQTLSASSCSRSSAASSWSISCNICPCSEPMSASCTTNPDRLRLYCSRVARGGRPCRLQVAPVRLLPPRGPSRASLLLSLRSS